MSKKIIGEGSYGCVHKPSLHCDKLPRPDFKYDNYVSKIMKIKEAKKELDKFVIIDSIDPNDKYHLGNPIMCKPEITKTLIKDVSSCKHINNFKKDQDEFSLLLLKYGGYDLKTFCSHIPKYFSTNKKEKLNKLLLEIHHLLKGLRLLKKYGLVHYDLKPQNILFNTETGKMYLIDFGLMNDKETIIENSKENSNYLGVFHWSYPLETGFMNKTHFDKYFKGKKPKRESIQKKLTDTIITDSVIDSYDLPLKNPGAFKTIFTYLNLKNVVPTNAVQNGYLNSFFYGFNETIKRLNYDDVLDQIVDSIDIYGLGMSLQYLTNCLMRNNIITDIEYNKLTIFLNKMWEFNILDRNTDIDNIIEEYENLLLELGVLTDLNIHFENNSVVKSSPDIPKSASSITSEGKPLSKALEEQANLDAVELGTALKTESGKSMKKYTSLNSIRSPKKTKKRKSKRKTKMNRNEYSQSVKSRRATSNTKNYNWDQ